MKLHVVALFACANLTLLAGCGSDEDAAQDDVVDAATDLDSTDTALDAGADNGEIGVDATDTSAEVEEPAPTLTEIRTELFTPGCSFSTCHGGRSGAAGLNLATNPYSALVDVEANDAPGRILVVPGDVAASYLYEKLTSDTPAAGERMPPGSPLDERRLSMVRRWIEAGALDN